MLPTVTIVIPTYQEADSIDACLAAVESQTYPNIVETLVVDGGSTDDTRLRAAAHPGVRVLDNPHRLQAPALNAGLEAASGDVVVRVDGHCVIAPDYVAHCVDALRCTGAAMVGGGMTPAATGIVHAGIAAAMQSRFGAGPARFHSGGPAGWVDTVYLGAYRTSDARAVGGYADDCTPNEDAEFAHRLGQNGGVWFDPSIQSTYAPRASLQAVARQFFFYGQGRARTVRKHPSSVRPRQLASPALLLSFGLPWRRWTIAGYVTGIAVAATVDGGPGLARRGVFAVALPVMHLTWAIGFLLGLAGIKVPPGGLSGLTHLTFRPETRR